MTNPAPVASDAIPDPAPAAELAPLGLRLRDSALKQLDAAVRQLGKRGLALHGGIHQARKALRRCRAILALGARRFGRAAKLLDADLGRLCRGLAPLRDAHALVETLERLPADAAALDAVRPGALAAARARRDELLARALQRDPAMQSRRQRIAVMRTRLETLPWTELREKHVARALARSVRRVARAERRARRVADHHDEAWHRLRRRVRRLRQQRSVLARLVPQLLEQLPPAGPDADLLGSAQDDALLLARCGARSPFDVVQRAVLRRVARERLARARA